ncbi:T9SS type A sorting domain-containing protein [Polaribacter sp. Asnod6-C07]|uniref:T9SS type A sorting domain-containing protein n=1 Tax=Polaribacter sp. Asnod6-C07 TaxID=3160582 RepID=UPI0038693D65
MKKITLLFLFCTIQSSFGQILTSVTEEYFSGSSWYISSKTDYSYNTNGDLIQEKYFADYNSDDVLELEETTTYSYNTFGRLIEENYNNEYKGEYTYNADNLLTTYISSEKENNVWVNNYKAEIFYNGTNIDYYIGYGWDGVNWYLEEDGSERIKYIYQGNNLVTTTEEDYINSSWVESGKEVFTYDASNRLIKEEYYNKDNDIYTLEEFYDYTYDSNNNIATQEGGYRDQSSTMNNFKPLTYQYDLNVNMSDITHPFKDKIGTKIYFDVKHHFINKILSESSDDSKITYNYNENTANTKDITLVDFEVYPNPATSLLTIKDNSFTIKKIELYNVLGKKVLSTNINKINIENLVNGVYLMKLETEEGNIVTKRIVKK